MSTILEALKKSEQERKLNKVPTLSNMATPQETSRWPLVGAIVAVILLLALIAFLVVNWFSGKGVPLQGSENGETQTAPLAVTNDSVGASDATAAANQSDEVVVNVVSYSEQAEQRFVMINGKLFREGEFVRGGLKVEAIKQDEVVLNSRGRRIVRKP